MRDDAPQDVPGTDDLIKGILFDIGGVLVALDGVPSLARWLGVEAEHDALHAVWIASPSVVAHETGKIDAAAFAAGVIVDLRLPVTAEAFLAEFLRWFQGPMAGARELLDEIPSRYRVAALSNTSAVTWDSITNTGLTARFEQMYLSHEIGCLKPAVEAFLIALEGMRLAPSEVLFLDDGSRNVEAARALGMRAHLARGPDECRRVLERYGVVTTNAEA